MRVGAVPAVDRTAAKPVLTRRLELAADFVMHLGTKPINGHTDVVAGVLSCRDKTSAVWQAVGIIGPLKDWLLMRGMRPLRLSIGIEEAGDLIADLKQALMA
ncbi:Cystathionine gamma-synthase/O-acetylhomoserine (thiol)-lyase [Roseovarius litorisediminis]|uniref:Cystathionine gamma-synthase/O-acetylhomoserine (Thiol)-lyase n=1 Tax=Roseovarius litorisediminis TaxID=1312363 RepID=A0A1Y5RB10_9RHOB|nr:PLP-dependent transferase [Roseovarius litorisediminis]SLN13247.1 Cystathionine gamma-synthase/O-acetylhomoserine (thiol)-lyase [Roseovarius litorisediminis]